MSRTYVIGDPQAPFAKVYEVLDRHGLLAGDRLAPDVRLISIGDHFDYDVRDPGTCAREGLAILRWLASHDPAQVTLLLGNHDAARVMELATITDETFAAARALASTIAHAEHAEGHAEARAAAKARAHAEFAAAYPTLPAPGVIGRDYASFTTEQRALVIELLLAGRFQLATTGVLADGRTALLTHAGVTTRELALLGEPALCEPTAIAALLEALLARAIDEVRDAWGRGELAPLSLAPLHLPGAHGAEGGGLLYHRPTDPSRTGADPRARSAPRGLAASIRARCPSGSRRSSATPATPSAPRSSPRGRPTRRSRASTAASAPCASPSARSATTSASRRRRRAPPT